MPGHFSKKFFEYPSTEWADLVHFLLSVRFRSVGLQTPSPTREAGRPAPVQTHWRYHKQPLPPRPKPRTR